jgi:hypothetical protein
VGIEGNGTETIDEELNQTLTKPLNMTVQSDGIN